MAWIHGGMDTWQVLAEEAIKSGKPIPPTPFGSSSKEQMSFAIAIYGVVVAGFAVFAGLWLYSAAQGIWGDLPKLLASRAGQFASAGVVLAVGGALFWLREHRLLEYASLEIGTAVATAINACSELATSQQDGRMHAMLALLAATYIVVRGYDNLHKYVVQRRARLAKLANLKSASKVRAVDSL